MNSKLKKLSIALAGIMSAAAITAVVPMGTVGTLGSVATVAHADTELYDEQISTDTVYNDNVTVPTVSTVWFGTEGHRCVVTINGNLTLEEGGQDPDDPEIEILGGLVYVNVNSLVIVNGDLHCKGGSCLLNDWGEERVIVTGNIQIDYGAAVDEELLFPTSLQNITYVPATTEQKEHFTSGGKAYIIVGNGLVEASPADLATTIPTSIQVESKDAYIAGGKGYMRYITRLTFDPSKTVESFGTWFVPSDLQATEDYATVQYDGSAITSGQSYNADLLGIPGTALDRSIVGISFVNFAGDANAVTTVETSTVNSIITGGIE